MDAETLDQLLARADERPGIAIISENVPRLHIAIRSRIRELRKQHPDIYSHLTLITSKSPRELYIVNREKAARPPSALPGGEAATERGDTERPA